MITATMRQWQYDAMQHALKIVGHIIANNPHTNTYRDGGTGWTVAETLGHLLDFERVFFERARLTAEQDFPPLPFPSPDESVAAGRYAERDAGEILAEWVTVRGAFIAYLQALPDEAWLREGNHPKRGALPLNSQLLLVPSHDFNHIEQMLHILAEQQ